jgi:hypothetical protein
MLKPLILGWLVVLGVLGCSTGFLEDTTTADSKTATKSSDTRNNSSNSKQELDSTALEPVPIGGGFLVCAKLDRAATGVGCRIESENAEKVEVSDLRPKDVSAFNANDQLVAITFKVETATSFWHWVAISEVAATEVAYVRLDRRFESDLGSAANEAPVMDQHPSLDEVSAAVGPPPGLAEMTVVEDDQVEARGVMWYRGAQGESCNQTCADRGGFYADATAEWTKNLEFCANLVQTMRPDVTVQAGVALNSDAGLGCFTRGTERVFREVSDVPVNGDSLNPNVNRLCACME